MNFRRENTFLSSRFWLKHVFSITSEGLLVTNKISKHQSARPCKPTWNSRFFFSVISIALSFALASNTLAQTEIEGEVSGVWDTEGSPYVIVDSAFVPANQRLVIDPGVEVVFAPRRPLTVHGELHAEGGEDDSIYFLGEERWGNSYLIFEDDASDNSLIAFSRLDSISIRVNHCSPTFRNSHFYVSAIYDRGSVQCIENLFNGPIVATAISAESRGTRIESCIFNDGRDLYVRTSTDVRISDSRLGEGSMIHIDQARDVAITNSSFERFIGNGIVNLVIIDCEAPAALMDVSHSEGLTMRGGTYGTLRGDHLTEADIDSCIFNGGVGWIAYEMTITNSRMNSIRATDWTILRVENCEIIASCEIWASNDIDIQIKGSVIGLMRVYSPNVLVENNTIDKVITGGQGNLNIGANRATLFRNNRILHRIECGTGGGGFDSTFFYRNDIGVWHNDAAFAMVYIRGTETTFPLFVNNTFHEQENSRDGAWLVKVISTGRGGGEFYNNLFLGDGHGSKGLNVCYEDRGRIVSDYNVFWGLDSLTNRCEIGEHSIVADPRVMNRWERDVHLLADSPLIDAGTDRLDEEDPDGTATDIGCYYFDRREDHPPFIFGEFAVEADPFNDFVYDGEVVDDGDDVEIEFEGLPEWLNEVDDGDDDEETFRLQGRPPQDDEDHYEFVIRGRDGSDQIDSLTVSMTVSPQRRLWGEISGRLTINGSPYVVTAPLSVPEDEELLIEPGVELRFRPLTPLEDLNKITRLDVYGTIVIEGTEQDSIVIRADTDEAPEDDHMPWEGIYVHASNDYSSVSMRYCHIEDGLYGVYLDNVDSVNITNCVFKNNNTGMYSRNGGIGIITHNLFAGNYSSGGVGLYDSLTLSYNVVLGFTPGDSLNNPMNRTGGGLGGTGRRVNISNNILKGGNGLYGSGSEYGIIKNNVVTDCNHGISSYYSRNVDICNNTLVNNRVRLIFNTFLDTIGANITNNLIYKCDTLGIWSTSVRDTSTIDVSLLTFPQKSGHRIKAYCVV